MKFNQCLVEDALGNRSENKVWKWWESISVSFNMLEQTRKQMFRESYCSQLMWLSLKCTFSYVFNVFRVIVTAVMWMHGVIIKVYICVCVLSQNRWSGCGCFEVFLRRTRLWIDQRITVEMLTRPRFCFLWRSWRPLCSAFRSCLGLTHSQILCAWAGFISLWFCVSFHVVGGKKEPDVSLWCCFQVQAAVAEQELASVRWVKQQHAETNKIHFKVPKVVIKLLQQLYALKILLSSFKHPLKWVVYN